MYQKGEVRWGVETDTRTQDYDSVEGAYLPHSCDRWVIGGVESIKLLIDDLQKLVNLREKK